MWTGLYSGAASLHAFEKRHEVSATNLANISTPGFRRRIAFMQESQKRAGRAQDSAIYPKFSVKMDFTPGNLYHTGDKQDLAILDSEQNDGNAFFALKDRNGQEFFARTARLEVDALGQLVDSRSRFSFTLPNGAPVNLAPGNTSVLIDEQGGISQNGTEVGQLKLVRFESLEDLRPYQHGLFTADPQNRTQTAQGMVKVKQGHKEASNANAVDELVDMVTNYRAYEATQRIIKQMDQSMQKLLRQTS
jgi:flagellar basal-body rod protein FlgG